jgi:hypothetical protein
LPYANGGWPAVRQPAAMPVSQAQLALIASTGLAFGAAAGGWIRSLNSCFEAICAICSAQAVNGMAVAFAGARLERWVSCFVLLVGAWFG